MRFLMLYQEAVETVTVVTVTEVTVFSGGVQGLSEYFQIVSNNNR